MASYYLSSDLELAELIANDDDQAFAEIYRRYKGVLFLHAHRMLGDQEEAKDILQELFTTLWLNRKEIKPHTSFSSYLYKALRNRIFDVISHKKVEQKYISSLAAFIEQGECITDQQIREKELTVLIEQEVSLLPPKMREVFEMSRNTDLSYKEIAQELHISDKTVKKQVSNALHILRQKLDLAFVLMYISKDL
ncbi:ECF RNA polymerase sigma factor SigW [Dyadobacter sp. CECT 9623]|uniref:ECF RNA polymerase sigma factor SigW n=1 Tax=Dyadobacter linearis TaxID=2823330 RepID=A0ABN7RGB1_9BACT|nr:RNA polymerase sigma-70 factor [Dyadobacter sp. CECT 9623]CAG5072711.1 ECF RNA polymerase sigma factor SigW [Dyadobacter sp. CECT 9623]